MQPTAKKVQPIRVSDQITLDGIQKEDELPEFIIVPGRKERLEARYITKESQSGKIKEKEYSWVVTENNPTYLALKKMIAPSAEEIRLLRRTASKMALDIDLRNSIIVGVNLSDGTHKSQEFYDNSNISYSTIKVSNLSNCDFSNSKAVGSVMEDVWMHKSNLYRMDFSNSTHTNVRYPKAIIFKAIFSNSELVNPVFLYSNAYGTDFSGSLIVRPIGMETLQNLEYAKFDGATVMYLGTNKDFISKLELKGAKVLRK